MKLVQVRSIRPKIMLRRKMLLMGEPSTPPITLDAGGECDEDIPRKSHQIRLENHSTSNASSGLDNVSCNRLF